MLLFSLQFELGMAISRGHSDLREKFDQLCSSDLKCAQEVLNHQKIQSAKNQIEKAIKDWNRVGEMNRKSN